MKNIMILLFTFFIAHNLFAQKKEALSVNEFKKAIKQKEVTILDVRTPEEFADGHIRKAVNVDWKNSEEFKAKALQLDKSTPLYLYCRSGVRSTQASNWLLTNGFTDVRDLNGGFEAWKKAGKRVSKKKN